MAKRDVEEAGDSKNKVENGETVIAIEKLAEDKGIPRWQLAGVMAANNWAGGKELTVQEFEEAVKSFLKSPMTGEEKKEGGKAGGKTT